LTIESDIAVALSPSVTHKNLGFDRTMPGIDFDSAEFVDLAPTGTRP
jgi:hypothetical protein